jgi:DNA-binding NarL/FixJ family response regulator
MLRPSTQAVEYMLTSAAEKIRILCVDDHPLVRDGIAYAIQKQNDMTLVAEAANGFEALACCREHVP